MFDLVASSIGLFLASPLLVAIGIAIRLESPGPVIFKQRRVGLNGRMFTVYKFRTMRFHPRRASHAPQNERIDFERFVFTPDASNPRITRLGKALRRTSFDELPQLLNVVRGEMALVGPRPEIPEIVAQYPPEYHVRHSVLPGITGLAQINGRADLTYAETIRYDLHYLRRRSFRNDLLILGRTLGAVLRARGAR